MRWLETTSFLGSPLLDWATALGVTLLALLVFWTIKRVVIHRLGKMAERTGTGLDDFVVDLARKTRLLLLAVPAAYLGAQVLDPPGRVLAVLKAAAILAAVVQVGLWASVALDFWVERTRRRSAQDATTVALMGVLGFIGKLILWSIVLLVALDNVGVDVTTLIAGLGVGGIAVALALQNVLGDLLASLSIVLDKPFVLGDSITVGEFTGKVENIGLKTTRVRSVSGEQVIFPNGDLLQSRIRNWARLVERRAVLNFGVLYQTPADKIEKVPGLVRGIVEAQEGVRFDRAHLMRLGASSIDFEAVYFILSPDYNLHMDRQQAVLLGLVRAFEAEGIEFAHPAPTVVIERGNPPRAPSG
jgi:small-conductance mechanosensitive channel